MRSYREDLALARKSLAELDDSELGKLAEEPLWFHMVWLLTVGCQNVARYAMPAGMFLLSIAQLLTAVAFLPAFAWLLRHETRRTVRELPEIRREAVRRFLSRTSNG